MNIWNAYVRTGKLYVPSTGVTPAGIFRDIEPVDVIDVTDRDRCIAAIARAIALGNPSVPDFATQNYSKPVVLGYAKVRSWSAFEKGCRSFGIHGQSDCYEVFARKDASYGGWIPDPAKLDRWPKDSTARQLASALYEKMVLPDP